MAGLIAQGVGTLFAAVSFSASGYLFQHLNKNGYEAEAKRHNKALEDLSTAKEQFYENEVKQHDRIQELRQQLSDANHDIENTNKALDTLRKVRTIQYKGVSYDEPPQLSDFYKPSNEMKEYQYLVMASVGVGSGLLVYRFI